MFEATGHRMACPVGMGRTRVIAYNDVVLRCVQRKVTPNSELALFLHVAM